jgi:hypothetical protein
MIPDVEEIQVTTLKQTAEEPRKFVLLRAVFWLLVLPIRMVAHGGILCLFWKWFVMRAFPVSPLNLCVAMGLLCVMSLLYGPKVYGKDKTKFTESVLGAVMHPLLTLFCGWVVHLFL